MDDCLGLRDYVIQFQPGRISEGIRNLERQGFEGVYVPTTPKSSRALFPGYGFVALDVSGGSGPYWQRINSTRGVVKLLPSHLEKPLSLPIGFVCELRDALLNYADELEVVSRWTSGAMVEIRSGALTGFVGEMVRYHKGSLELLLTLLGTQRRVIVPSHQCAAPPAPALRARIPVPT
jgi:transcription antitermination factor NusG